MWSSHCDRISISLVKDNFRPGSTDGQSESNNLSEDLKGKNLGVIRGWSCGAPFDKSREEGLFKADDNVSDSANFRKLVIGRLDGVIAIEAAADMVIAKEGFGKALVALDKPLAVNSTYLAFAKKANKLELIKKFNQAMQEMKADGSFQAAVNEFVE